MIKKTPVCNVCDEPDGATCKLIGLAPLANDDPGYDKARIEDTEQHICMDCLSELSNLFNRLT